MTKERVTGVWKDHTGRLFPTLTAMCNYYHLNYQTFNERFNKGWSLEDALTKKKKRGRAKSITYQGKQYDTIAELAQVLNVSAATLGQRIKRNYPKELWGSQKKVSIFFYFKGVLYSSMSDAARHFNVNVTTALNKYNSGESLEEIFGGKNDN